MNLKLLIILFIILIIRNLLLKYNPKIIFNGYLILFIITFSLLYFNINNYSLSLFFGLFYIIIITIYKYNQDNKNLNNNKNNTILFIISMIGIYLIINYKNIILNSKIINYLPFFNVIMISYILSSVFEWCIHKYIMHCNIENDFNKTDIVNTFIKKTCKNHINHHINTNKDMSLLEKNDSALFMGWNLTIPFTISVVLCIYISFLISNVNPNKHIIKIIFFSILFIILWQLIWNIFHPNMHKHLHNYNNGPYIQNIQLPYLKKKLYNNHSIHHLQKGKRKGNYNVILFGADEWLNTNNKDIDNSEYCKLNPTNKNC